MALLAERVLAGRPPKVDDSGRATRERLLAAAVSACAERGFEAATLADIAHRAGVSAPAVYNHFDGKDDLMVAAGRWALDGLRPADSSRMGAVEVVQAFLAEDFAGSRRLLTELHLAAHRHPRLADLLANWQTDHTNAWRRRITGRDARPAVTTFFAILLGLCQIDSLAPTPAERRAVVRRAEQAVRSILPEEVW